jgi:hypothetical protein
MAKKKRAPATKGLSPVVRRIIALDEKPMSIQLARRLTAAQVAELKAVVRGGVLPEGRFSRAHAIAALAQRDPSKDLAMILAVVVANSAEDRTTRATAAASLELIRHGAAETALIANIDTADPIVRSRVIRSLGVIGEEPALQALERASEPADEPGRRQLALARSLVAHRLGTASSFLRLREGVDRPGDKKDAIPLTMRQIDRKAIAKDRKALRGTDFGVKVSDRIGFSVSAGSARWTLFLNRDIVNPSGFARLFERPWIAGLMSRYDEWTKGNTVQYVVLTDPDDGGASVMIVRTDGELFHSGHASRRDEGLFGFSVLSVDHPGAASTKVLGHLTPKGVTLDLVAAFGRRKQKQRGETVVV